MCVRVTSNRMTTSETIKGIISTQFKCVDQKNSHSSFLSPPPTGPLHRLLRRNPVRYIALLNRVGKRRKGIDRDKLDELIDFIYHQCMFDIAVTVAHNSKPNARPIHAPVAIVGKKIPAGTIIPNAHAVKPTFIIAVTRSKNMLAETASGLACCEAVVCMPCYSISLAQAVIVCFPIALEEKV